MPSGADDWLHCSVGEEMPPGNTVPSYGYSHFREPAPDPPAMSAFTFAAESGPGHAVSLTGPFRGATTGTPPSPPKPPPEPPPEPPAAQEKPVHDPSSPPAPASSPGPPASEPLSFLPQLAETTTTSAAIKAPLAKEGFFMRKGLSRVASNGSSRSRRSSPEGDGRTRGRRAGREGIRNPAVALRETSGPSGMDVGHAGDCGESGCWRPPRNSRQAQIP